MVEISAAYEKELDKLEEARKPKRANAKIATCKPRMGYAKDKRKALNTCASPKRSVWQRKADSMRKHIDIHPHDAASVVHLAKINLKLNSMPQEKSHA